jgi:protein-disulfide isomerase
MATTPALEKYMTPIAVVLGALIIALALAFGRGGAPADNEPAGVVDVKNVQTDESPYIGEKDAPVTIAVWFDYQCPFCKRFELEVLEQVYQNYVVNGDVRIVYKDFQFLGPDSQTAALFARAVWDAHPNRFHDWYKAVMTAQDEEHGGFGNLESIKTLSATIEGIDVNRVVSLMEEKESEYAALIQADREEGAGFGINGTPGAIIGTTLLTGARPYAEVKAAIDAELAK